MKTYLVYVDKWDYDEFDAVVVVAKDESRALEMIKTGYFGGSCFNDHQGEIYVEEVNLAYEHIVLGSFNAG